MGPPQLGDNFLLLADNVAFHRPTGLVVSVSRGIILTPLGRFRLEHPTAMKALQDNKCDYSVYNALFENAEIQNYIVVKDAGLSSVVEVVTVSVCGTCKKYCNTSLTGNGFKDHYKKSDQCRAKTFPNFKMKGFRLFMAKKRCVFLLIEEEDDGSPRSPTPEADVLKTPKGNTLTIGQLGLPLEMDTAGGLLPLKETVTQTSPHSYSTSPTSMRRHTATPSTTVDMTTYTTRIHNGVTGASSSADPLSYPKNTPHTQSNNYTPETSTPQLHQPTLSFASNRSVVDSSSEVSPLMGNNIPHRPEFEFRVPSSVPPKPVASKKARTPSSHSTPQLKAATLRPSMGNTEGPSLRTSTSRDLYEARDRLQVPVATTSSNYNFTNANSQTPPKRSSTSMSFLPPPKRSTSYLQRSMTPAVNGLTMFASPKKIAKPSNFPQPSIPLPATIQPPPLYNPPQITTPSTRGPANEYVPDVLNNARWALQQTLLRESQVVGLTPTAYVSKVITPGTMENKMISPTLLLQAILTRIRPLDEDGWFVAITGPWSMTVSEPSTGLHLDLFIRPASNGPEDVWTIQIKITSKTDGSSMTTCNDLQWPSVNYHTVCSTLLCFTAIMKELFNTPLCVDTYATLKSGLPMFLQMVETHSISGADVIRGWLNDTMQTSNPRRVTVAGAPLG